MELTYSTELTPAMKQAFSPLWGQSAKVHAESGVPAPVRMAFYMYRQAIAEAKGEKLSVGFAKALAELEEAGVVPMTAAVTIKTAAKAVGKQAKAKAKALAAAREAEGERSGAIAAKADAEGLQAIVDALSPAARRTLAGLLIAAL